MRRKQRKHPSSRNPSRIPTQPVQSLLEPAQYQGPSTPGQSFHYPDSLERLQMYLDRQMIHSKERQEIATIDRLEREEQLKRKRKAHTETESEFDDSDRVAGRGTNKKMSAVLSQLGSLRDEMRDLKVNTPRADKNDDKFDRLLNELVKQREHDLEMIRQQQRHSQPNPYPFFNPFAFQQPQHPQQSHHNNSKYSRDATDFKRGQRRPMKKMNWMSRKLKKYFRAVAFTIFLRNQARRLTKKRKGAMRIYYMDSFDRDMVQLKNWLLEGMAYSLPVILQKQNLNWCFWDEKRSRVREQRMGLCLKLVQLGLQKLRKECSTFKILQFGDLLVNLCGRGAFTKSRFWSAEEMEHICISQSYGCVRAEESLESFMICMVVWVKMLVFNMLLQPHKFDSVNFPSRKQPLSTNMHILASIYYRLARQVISDHLTSARPKQYRTGNWLKVPEQFVVECCEPLLWRCEFGESGEWVSGLLGREELGGLEERGEWRLLVQRMKEIGGVLHKEMLQRRKVLVRNQINKVSA